jgi:hypothetical protein
MNCRDAEELILESLDRAQPPTGAEFLAHMATCPDCKEFHRIQSTLDASLASHFAAPELTADFSDRLQALIAAEKRRALWEALPDVLPIAAGAIATGLCIWLSPLPVRLVATGGLAFTAAAVMAQAVFRALLDAAEEPQD